MSLLRVVIVVGVLCGLPAAAARAEPLYRVQAGDTLGGIARHLGTTVARLERLNRLSPNDPLLAGTILKLPLPAVPELRYRVQAGDPLTGIALRFHTTPAAIAAASGLADSQPILIGTTLHVPDPDRQRPAATVFYRVRSGDTLGGIALRYGVSVGALADLNHRALSAPLWVGTRLALPPGTIVAQLEAPQSSVRTSLVRWANHYGVNPQLATALAWMESGFNNSVVSTAGAVGVMQITPETWSYVQQVLLLGERVPDTSDGNVRIGVAYLHHLLHLYGGNPQRALAAYYQGARSLDRQGLLPGTSQYVDDILALEQRF